jgi:hypothetical protein
MGEMAETRQMDEHAHETGTNGKALRRRGLIAGAAALVAGALAQRAATDVAAANGDGLVLGNTGVGYPSGQITTAITGISAAVSGNPGLWLKNNFAAAADAYQDGIQGYAASANAGGVFGRNNDTNGIGVSGAAPNGLGIFGGSTGGSGVAGNSSTGAGVYGQSSSGIGVQASSTSSHGVSGSAAAASMAGVYGYSNAASGYGIYGINQNATGYAGGFTGQVVVSNTGTSGHGLTGITAATTYGGVYGTTNTNGAVGIYGLTTNASAYAGYFTGAVVVNGSFTVVDPTNKHGAIKHPDGSYRLLYSVESPESWIEDFGTGTLTGGKATVTLDKDFAAIAQTDEYHVFPISRDPNCKGLAVAAQSASGFVVQEMNGGTSSGGFSYRVVARPKTDAKAQRLAKVALPHPLPAHALAAPTALSTPPAPPAPPKLPDRK